MYKEGKETTRGVHDNLRTNPLAQTARADLKTGRPDASDGRRRVSATKNWLRRVGWRVFFFKTQYTQSDRQNPWEKVGVPRSVQIHQYSDEGFGSFWLDLVKI